MSGTFSVLVVVRLVLPLPDFFDPDTAGGIRGIEIAGFVAFAIDHLDWAASPVERAGYPAKLY